ncbi:uncharacterized protein LOC123016065 [Tribolium madens]|uniref:uncharacterized protein LOC123016065 n=1 Tax=Tribolium madens TaxID=41895 RepID=UPI001CF74837|nr:uncharacterized protein LOC123016065 [Tribolium madens]
MQKIFFAILIFALLLFYIFYTSSSTKIGSKPPFSLHSRYLVHSQKCKIPSIDPFDNQVKDHFLVEKYQPCGPSELPTFVTIDDNVATLHINPKFVEEYPDLACYHRKIGRPKVRKNPDNFITLGEFQPFQRNVQLDFDFVSVLCKSANRTIYTNTHAALTVKKTIIEKQDVMKNRNEAFSVLIVGIDSISRLNFIRILRKSYLFLWKNNWITLKGYNKIDDNTYPNIMALLSGLNEKNAQEKCPSTKFRGLDRCPLIWYDFRNSGYATAYAEDETRMSTFNLNKKGFSSPPTDYYFRPYLQSAEKLKIRTFYGLKFCTGPENTGERVLNLAKNFSKILKNRPNFGFFWMNSFSHNDLNSASAMDEKISQFLQDVSNSGVLQNSFMVFLSDHGTRWGDFRETPMGWYEERLPFIYLWVPENFKKRFPQEFRNLKLNVNKLTTTYDVYMTLQHILVLSGQNYTMKPSQGCPKCRSLFDQIQKERSCEDAGIEPHWCTCINYSPINQTNLVESASSYVLQYINGVITAKNAAKMCRTYTLGKIISARISDDQKFLLLVLETTPKAIFEVTVWHRPGSKPAFSVKGGISRIDRYRDHSICMRDDWLKKLCYCR